MKCFKPEWDIAFTKELNMGAWRVEGMIPFTRQALWKKVDSYTLDEGSNMLKGWRDFEGTGYVCHRQQNCLGTCLDIGDIKSIISKIKGICAHFH